MKPEKTLSIVIGSFNRKRYLQLAIESVRAEIARARLHAEIIVIDGGSDDGSLAWLVKQKDILTIIQHNRGQWNGLEIERRSWGYFMNLGFKAAQGKFTCMLSDDCLVVPGAIANGIQRFEQRLRDGVNIGALAFYWRNWPEQDEYWVGLTLGNKMFVNHGLYLTKALAEVGYADEENYMFYHADGDLCLKLWQAGYCCEDAPDSFVEHYSHANQAVRSSNLAIREKDWAGYLEKWTGIFYSPETHNAGDWIRKNYHDEGLTARKFLDGMPFFKRLKTRSARNLKG